jgi:tetratricopeptide (TPR) repeat protein
LANFHNLAPRETLIRVFEKGLEAVERLDDKTAKAKVQAMLAGRAGLLNMDLGRLRRARDFFELSERAARQVQSQKLLAAALTGSATVLSLEGAQAEAAVRLLEARGVANAAQDALGEAVAVFHLGQLARNAGRPQEAVDHYGIALEIFRGRHREDLEAGVLFELGVICVDIGRFDAAFRLLNDCLRIHQGSGSLSAEAQVRIALGRTYLGRGDVKEAASEFEHAARLSRECSDRLNLGRANFGEAAVALLRWDGGEARERLSSAWELARECSDLEGERQAFEELERLKARTCRCS